MMTPWVGRAVGIQAWQATGVRFPRTGSPSVAARDNRRPALRSPLVPDWDTRIYDLLDSSALPYTLSSPLRLLLDTLASQLRLLLDTLSFLLRLLVDTLSSPLRLLLDTLSSLLRLHLDTLSSPLRLLLDMLSSLLRLLLDTLSSLLRLLLDTLSSPLPRSLPTFENPRPGFLNNRLPAMTSRLLLYWQVGRGLPGPQGQRQHQQ
ncbi:hypothetical protein NDU88_002552 [Pleurodeles waltl]|uniref:Uncharacterized protein n=1 Tax=Pleurodeles waltl TaxID=8319 RepID=A0AAV7PAC0_PLEWA|nr:hypothetical protein NDU88_002552 [Pleurodeles waltl]